MELLEQDGVTRFISSLSFGYLEDALPSLFSLDAVPSLFLSFKRKRQFVLAEVDVSCFLLFCLFPGETLCNMERI